MSVNKPLFVLIALIYATIHVMLPALQNRMNGAYPLLPWHTRSLKPFFFHLTGNQPPPSARSVAFEATLELIPHIPHFALINEISF